jgi:hypothetical protein
MCRRGRSMRHPPAHVMPMRGCPLPGPARPVLNPVMGKRRSFLRDNGLSLVLLLLFLGTWVGQWLTGWHEFNDQQAQHGRPLVGVIAYLATGHFLEATGENWESEFLQMGLFVVLTAFLFQRGSPESNDPDAEEPEQPPGPASPWPVRRGGAWLALYRYSLSLVFLLLFLASLLLHALGGLAECNEDRLAHHQPPQSLAEYAGSSRFWFESFQNWQSEFLSLVSMVWLAVYLRHEGSAESKPVAASHDQQE